MHPFLRDGIRRIPAIARIVAERDDLRARLRALSRPFPPGHFYSPIPAIDAVGDADTRQQEILDLDLNVSRQLELLAELAAFHADLPFQDHPGGRARYYYLNGFFSYLDAICLYGIIRYARPERIVEVGSGFSSCVMIDTNQLFMGERIACTHIEPYPDRLRSLLRPGDRAEIVEAKVQDADLDLFTSLESGDILFIDSSHVCKTSSDVNYMVFVVLPKLKPGVYVHFHDIYYPFEYPIEWRHQGVAWNEAYLIRAFLQNNSRFTVQLFNSFLKGRFRSNVEDALPLAAKDPSPDKDLANAPAGSLWLLST